MSAEGPPKWRVVSYTTRGQSPVEELLNDLSAAERAAAAESFRLLQEFGVLLGMPHAKHIQGKL